MTRISTIDIQTRMDVQELLSQFSHFLDHDRGTCWANLFTTDGVFECVDGQQLVGAAALATLPSLVHGKGHGSWRHLITAVVIDRSGTAKDLTVRAYCPVIDMDLNNAMAAFYDFEFTLRFGARWRIRHALAKRVGTSMTASVGAAAVTNGAMAGLLLQ